MDDVITYKVDVNSILEEIGGSLPVSDTIDLERLVVGDTVFPANGPVSFDVLVIDSGEALVATGTVSMPVKAVCSRCLIEFDTVIEGEVEGAYRRDPEADPEDEFEPIGADGTVDIGPALLSALVVEAPFAPLHDPDCQGLCSQCGAEIASGTCRCGDTPDDAHPFASLKDMLDPGDSN